MEPHNTWVSNASGSTLVIPIGDLAQTLIAVYCYLVQNGVAVYDDVNKRPIPGLDRFRDLIDPDDNPRPLSYLEFHVATELTAELSTATYAGALMLQALGLGGWMYDGIDMFGLLGVPVALARLEQGRPGRMIVSPPSVHQCSGPRS